MFVTGRYQLADRAQIATSNDAGSRGWAASGGTGRSAMPWDESRVRIGQELLQHRAWAVKQRDRGTKRQVARVQAGQRDPELASLIVIPRIEGRLGCGLKCRRRPGGRRDPGLGGRVAVPGGRRDPDERLGDRRRPQRVATAPGGAAPSRRRGGDLRRRRATSIRPSYERPLGGARVTAARRVAFDAGRGQRGSGRVRHGHRRGAAEAT